MLKKQTVYPMLLLIDTSFSTEKTGAIDNINKALQYFIYKLKTSPLTANVNVELAILQFNSNTKIVSNFTNIRTIQAPILTGTGLTNMEIAIDTSVHFFQSRISYYKANNINYEDATIFMITDGLPIDIHRINIMKAKVGQFEGKFNIACTAGANMNILKQLSTNISFIDNIKYDELFLNIYKTIVNQNTR